MDLKLQVLLQTIDKATAPLKGIAGRSAETARALRATRQRLKELDQAQAQLSGFRQLKAGTRQLGATLEAARAKATALGKAFAATEAPTRAQTRAFAAARREAAQLERQHQADTRRLAALRAQLAATGINTRALAQHERRLREDTAAANRQLAAQQAQLQRLSARQRQMDAARQARDRMSAAGANVSVSGLASLETGRHLLHGVAPAITEAKAFQAQAAQFRALGVGEAMVTDATRFAQGLNIMGASATDNLKLLKESYSVLRDMHEAEIVAPYLARLKFGIEAVMAQQGHGEGHGEQAEGMFMSLLKVAELRGAAKNPETLKRVLDYATQAYVSSGGLVTPDDLLAMIKTGGIAAKQLDNTSFFFGLLHTMQEMGGHRAGTGLATAYQNWAAGRSTQQSAEELAQLGLLNPNAVQYGTTGHVKKVLPDALKEGELYRSNPFEYLMTRVVPKLNPTGQLSDTQVISKINALYSGRKGGDLFASLFLERANIAKQLAAAPKAYGVEALYREASQTAAGQELDLVARRNDLYRELGTEVLPLYVAGLEKLVALLRAVNGFAQRHPALAKGLMIVAGTLGVILAAAGGLMVTLGGLVGQFALLRFAVRAAGLSGLFPAIAAGARVALAAVAGFGWPVAALVAALVGGALLVRKFWGPISAWFSGVWEGIRRAAGPVLNAIAQGLAPLKPAWDAVAGAVATVWGWVQRLLAPFEATQAQLDGARQRGVAFGEALGAVLGGVARAVTFGTRLFVGLGVAIGDAAAWLMDRWSGALDWLSRRLDAVKALIDRLSGAWAGLHGAPVGAAGQPIEWVMPDDRERARRIAQAIARGPAASGPGEKPAAVIAPVSARASRNVHVAGDTVHLSIDARGMDHTQVHAAVRRALDDHARAKQARARSAYTDGA